jgi:hypothetical protein
VGCDRRIILSSLLVATTLLGCRKQEDPGAPRPLASATTSAAPPVPPDHLLPGELGEGKEIAFGLVLPRGFTVERRFADAIHASGSSTVEHVAAYVRRRVVASTVEVGPARTIFASAQTATHVPVTIEITDRSGQVELVVRDLTPPPIPQGLSDEERWKRAGLRPDGTPIDPSKVY